MEKNVNDTVDLQDLTTTQPYSEILFPKPDEKFLEQLDPETICTYLEQTLRGYKYNIEKDKWEPIPGFKQKITEEGINEIMLRVRPMLSPNTIYSNLDKDIIINIVLQFGEELATFLAVNHKKFNLSPLDIRKITHLCCDAVYIAMMRGERALTLRALRTMIQAHEYTAITKQQEQKRGGFFGLLKR